MEAKTILDVTVVETKKTSVRMPKSLWMKLKLAAASTGKDAEVIITEALTEYLESPNRKVAL